MIPIFVLFLKNGESPIIPLKYSWLWTTFTVGACRMNGQQNCDFIFSSAGCPFKTTSRKSVVIHFPKAAVRQLKEKLLGTDCKCCINVWLYRNNSVAEIYSEVCAHNNSIWLMQIKKLEHESIVTRITTLMMITVHSTFFSISVESTSNCHHCKR